MELFTNVSLVSSNPTIFTVLAMLFEFWATCMGPLGVRKVPGPPVIPFVGHHPIMAKYGPDLFQILAKQFHMGRQPLVIVADAELCREVGIKKFKDIPNRSMPSPIQACPLHQKGLFFTSRHTWLAFVPTMQSFVETATRNIDPSKEEEDITFSKISLALATDTIAQAAFGVNFGLSKPQSNSDSVNKIDGGGQDKNNDNKNDAVSKFTDQYVYSVAQVKMDLTGSLSIILGLLFPILQEPFRQILKRIPGTMDRKIERTNDNLSSRLDEIVEKRMKDNDRGSKDFLSLILNARESEKVSKKVFTPDYISALTYEHLVAGSATTAFTLSTTVYLIAQYPEVEKKLLAELDAFGPADQMPTAHDLQNKFPYVDQVIKESMRLYPVSPLIARETSSEVEIGGYVLPKGTWVWLALGVLAKDPKNFPEPHKFKPERFDPTCKEEKQRPSLCFYTLWPWTSIMHWSEIFPARNKALADSFIPEICIPAHSQHGDTSGT
ncbi:hypothetical protein GBA52_008786 [Prunus armeniaca]|nr:hypothetical protein GBA52_008786 [Prunus armeniaca]